MEKFALGIIDAQRGFMPPEEGEQLDRAGFGQLPVPDGHRIIPVIKRLLWAAGPGNTFTTQDWHPAETAHFSDTPDYHTNWPIHCVQETNGAALHPTLESALGSQVVRFYKGQEQLQRDEDDLSYSGYYAKTESGVLLPEWLQQQHHEQIVLGGLALDYCVGKTALDLRTKLGLDVTVALDATRGITAESTAEMLEQLKKVGVATASTDELLQEFAA